MRVAIFEPEPRICGPVVGEFYLQRGFRELGHECDVISSTKSGKPRASWGDPRYGCGWSPYAPDLTIKHAQIAECLATYDLVFLGELRCAGQDKDALKAGGKPPYVEGVIGSGTPFVTTMFSNDYTDDNSPFMYDLLDADNSAPRHLTMAWRSVESNPRLQEREWVKAVLPYDCRHAVWDPPSRLGITGSTGRMTTNKGHHLGVRAVIELMRGKHPGPFKWQHEVWGASSIGMSGNETYTLWKMVRGLGLEGTRHGNQPDTFNGGDIIRPYRWEARNDDLEVRYMGNYADAVGVSERLQVTTHLTSKRFSSGVVEWAVLEALDAGCVVILPEHTKDDYIKVLTCTSFENAPSMLKTEQLKDDYTKQVIEELVGLFDTALSLSDKQRQDLAAYNRSQVNKHNASAVVARQIIEATKR